MGYILAPSGLIVERISNPGELYKEPEGRKRRAHGASRGTNHGETSPGTGRKVMAHSFHSLLVHLIFSTKNRRPDLSPGLVARLFPYMGGIIRERRGTPLIINGPSDHVHLLVCLPSTESVAELMRVVKTNSSRWVHETFPEQRRFGWQGGYGAFTVSQSQASNVRDYIASQQEHHRTVSFQKEFLTFLRKNGIPYDERDLWA